MQKALLGFVHRQRCTVKPVLFKISYYKSRRNFHVSGILETSKRSQGYFVRPRRRRSSPAEMEPSFFARARERSMILRNLRLVLSATVSSSALRMGMTAANGFPRLMTMIGSFLAFSAYSDSGPDAFLNRARKARVSASRRNFRSQSICRRLTPPRKAAPCENG